MDKVSVIVPIYKTEKYLDQCIQSIVKQTYKDIEIILVDDGSPDNCGKICDKWSEIDKRITVIHQCNEGVAAARNNGIDVAKGEYICFVDSDDFVDKTYVEKLLLPMERCKLDLTVCGMSYLCDDGFVDKKIINDVLTGNFWKDFPSIRKFLLGPCCKIFLKAIIDEHMIRFPVGIRMGEDQAFTFLYYIHVTKYAFVNEPLYQYCIGNENSLCHQGARYEDTASFVFVYDVIRRKLLEVDVPYCHEIVNTYVVEDIINKFSQTNSFSERNRQVDLLHTKLDFNHSAFGWKNRIVMQLVRYRLYFPLFACAWLKSKMRG